MTSLKIILRCLEHIHKEKNLAFSSSKPSFYLYWIKISLFIVVLFCMI